MQAIDVSLSPQLMEAGGYLSLSDTLDVAGYDVGQLRFALKDGVAYHAQLSNTGSALVLLGSVAATAVGECARCLTPVEFDIDSELEGYYLLSADAPEAEGLEEDEYEVIGARDTIDLSDAVIAALTVGTPQVLLCKPDCKGLCPTCGADLNAGPCSCDPREAAYDETNPFYQLKDLVFSEDPEEGAQQ